ncbi:MAG: histidinol phosphate phosphatase, partial [Clostridia bacterium]|nr:histidinol phosphate phosphatase [Clostridia bacterium]
YVKKGDVYIDVDWNADYLQDEIKKHYGSDVLGFAEDYFALVGDVLRVTGADIIGHFDLLTKFNEKTPIFDENHPRYIAAWKAAIDKILPYNRPFEINTGAISRGYRTTPYPSKAQLEYIYQNGGKIILCSDAHNVDSLCCGYKEAVALAREVGFEI